MKTGIILLVLIIMTATVITAVILDKRSITLRHMGALRITPPADTYINKNSFWTICKGNGCINAISTNLFPEIKFGNSGLKFRDHPYPKYPEYSIEWPAGLIFEDELDYFVCVGCEIEEATYNFHTKFTEWHGKFVVDKVTLIPLNDKSIINIYESDILAMPL